MIRDLFRTACVLAVLAVAASLLVEVRFQLASIDVAHHRTVSALPGAMEPQPAPAPQPGRLRAVGRATLDLADAAIGVFR